MASLKARLDRLEDVLSDQERPFFSYCQDWQRNPEHRPQIAQALGVNEAAAAYMCTVELQHGRPADRRFPFEAWTTAEIRTALNLIDKN